jgi:hypothetical protein
MKELDWDEGRNYRLLLLGAEGHSDRFPDLVKNLFAQRVYVLVALRNAAIEAAKHASTTIPIVGMTDDMVRSALAAIIAWLNGRQHHRREHSCQRARREAA